LVVCELGAACEPAAAAGEGAVCELGVWEFGALCDAGALGGVCAGKFPISKIADSAAAQGLAAIFQLRSITVITELTSLSVHAA
jgi:hypothetical protein